MKIYDYWSILFHCAYVDQVMELVLMIKINTINFVLSFIGLRFRREKFKTSIVSLRGWRIAKLKLLDRDFIHYIIDGFLS